MNLELPVGTDALLSERRRLEDLLAASEDWRALAQLRSRQDRGEGLSAIDSARLETLLLDALADNPHYKRYKAVSAALAGGSRGSEPAPLQSGKSYDGSPVDDLTRIRGIDASMAKRLRALGIWSFQQIGDWTSIDIHRVSNELGIGKLIHSQNWIEQAALLALANPRAQPAATMSRSTSVPAPPKPQFSEPIVLPKLAPLPVTPDADGSSANGAAAPPAAPAAPPRQPAATAPAAAQTPGPIAKVPPHSHTSAAKPVAGDTTLSPAAASLLPIPPTPLRVAAVPPSPPVRPQTPVTITPGVAAVDTPQRTAPKPQVVTREPVASLARETTPPPPSKAANSATAPQPAPIATKAAPAAPAGVPVPTMTISEAIAYAAAAARSSQKSPAEPPTAAKVEAKSPPPPPVPTAVVAPSALQQNVPQQSAPQPSAPQKQPLAPPPLPEGFKAPEPPPPRAVVRPRMTRTEPTPRALAIDREREELGVFSGNIEEASVEIVRKSAPVAQPPPKVALAAAAAAAQEAVQQRDMPVRGATPIGRFLKALTGN